MSPVKISKVKGTSRYTVSTPGGTKAKGTTKAKAQRQANLLRGVEHGWKPTGKPARKPAPKGHHRMPSGKMMKDSEMMMKGKAKAKAKKKK